jgi:hypothetical protein
MLFGHDFEVAFELALLALLGMVLIGSLGNTLRLSRWHPGLIGAVIGALVGVVLIESVPMMT